MSKLWAEKMVLTGGTQSAIAQLDAKPNRVGCMAANRPCTGDALDVVPLLLGYMS